MAFRGLELMGMGRPAARIFALAVVSLVAILGPMARRSSAQQAASAPSTPSTLAANPASREAQLEARLLKLEAMNQKILDQYEVMDRKHNERYATLSRDFESLRAKVQQGQSPAQPGSPSQPQPQPPGPGGGASSPPSGTSGSDPDGDQIPEGSEGTIGRGTDTEGMTSQGGGAGGTDGDRVGATPYGPSDGVKSGGDTTRGGGNGKGANGTIGRRGKEGESRPISTTIGNGLRFESEDQEFQLQFHDLTQAEFRYFPGAGGQSPLKDQFFVPRQRWYFTGRATKHVEFYTDLNRGYGSIDLLDAFINYNIDPRFQTRVGRTKTPTSYEYYQIAEGDLIAPERSLYTGNFSGNRQVGIMEHGQILDKRAEYAIGVFNGPRRSFSATTNSKNLYAFFNVRPFQKLESSPLQYFNIGAEYDFGNGSNPGTQPMILTTANDQSAAASSPVVRSLSPTFFMFNSNVVESGYRAHTSAWIAWFYKSFNLLAQFDGGFQDYALASGPAYRTKVAQNGYFVQAYYFLTGEEIKRRVDVEPKRPFKFKDGRLESIGAVEVHARYSVLDLSHNVFSSGFADPNLWSNHAQSIDLGFNWYPYKYTKIYFDWQHSLFGNPVYNGPRTLARSADLLWLRFQLFF
ncbi:OprO/OprP family phosphate-selective porin [Singulisphaera sp. PoT]|uniref:OprO/OprP family phosphate-selective porin n=1 Tax=Singulisphaera sp. PoT TaxID=3411797 RepID=UPI003BF4D8F6